MSRLRAAWASWVRLWDHHEHPRALAMLRIVLPLVIAWDFVTIARLDLADALLGPAGLADPLGKDAVPFAYRWLPAEHVAPLLVFAMLALCLLVSAGVFTPVTLLLLVLVYAQTEDVLPVSDRAIDRLVRNVFVLLWFSRCGAWLSFDAWRRTGSPWGDGAPVPAWPRHLVVLQLVMMYFAAGVSKLGIDWTPMGGFNALWFIWQDPTLSAIDPRPWPWLYPLARLGAAGTMLWEWTAPIVLVLYAWRHAGDGGSRVRALANRWRLHVLWLAVGVVFHVGIAITLELGIFSYAMLGCYLAFVHPDDWLHLGQAIARRVRREVRS